MIKMVLDPDKINDKEMGAASLIKKLVIVIVMLGTSGFVFDALYTVQKLVIENNVILSGSFYFKRKTIILPHYLRVVN